MNCPCGSGDTFEACCGPRLDGTRPAPTAEALMRSRYTAFTQGNGAYILATQLPSVSGESAEAISNWARSVAWVRLAVLGRHAGGPKDSEGRVTFEADSFQDGEWCVLRETSAFVRIEGAWRYASGDTSFEHHKVERNAPCPCGSGRKYKACHA